MARKSNAIEEPKSKTEITHDDRAWSDRITEADAARADAEMEGFLDVLEADAKAMLRKIVGMAKSSVHHTEDEIFNAVYERTFAAADFWEKVKS